MRLQQFAGMMKGKRNGLRRIAGSLRTPGSSAIAGMVLMGLALVCVITYWAVAGLAVREIVLYSGQEGGTYQPLAVEIARLIEQENPRLRVRVETSAGSYENLEKIALQQEPNAIGILQNDVRIPERLADEGNDLRSLLPLHQG